MKSCTELCKTVLLSFENHSQNVMPRCPPVTCTMAQYFSQPFPKPVWSVFIHYSVVNKICIKLEQNWAFEYILETVAVMKSPFPMFIFVQEWITLRLPSGNWLFGAVFLLPSGIDVASERADILALKHVSRIFEHCNNPALPFCPVRVCGISSCSVLKYWLENE